MERDILAEINELLADGGEYDPSSPNIGDRWVRLYRAVDPAPTTTSPGTIATPVWPPIQPRARTVPRVGTVVQRSDAVNRRKQEGLLAVPPPLPPHRGPASRPVRPRTEHPSPLHQQPEPLRTVGPRPPPPVRVEIRPGLTVDIPHFAVYVGRKYKLRIPEGRFVLRFNRDGSLRSVREVKGV